MAEAKPTASLSSGLLARKGTARPAMRRQGLGGHIAAAHDDLGWNDMGHDPDHDEHESHVAHVADIMPMLSPMGAKPVALVPQDAAAVSEPEGHDEAATPGEADAVARSPLSVKPGKPPVVLQREALEDRVRTPAPSVPIAHVESPIDEKPATAAPTPPSEAVAQAHDVEPATAERAPTPAAAPKSAPAARKPAKAARVIRTPSRRPARVAGAKAAFTLRIDADRHLRLRLASALTNLSAQQILTDAFDAYLETIPEVEALAGNVARHNTDRS